MKFQKHFGLDIGTTSIKLVQLDDAGKGTFKLVTKGMVAVPEKSDTQEKNDLAVIEAIKTVAREAKVTVKQTVISLPESQVYTRVIEMPYLEEPELSAAIKWQSEQFLPVPVDEVVQRHQVISTPITSKPAFPTKAILALTRLIGAATKRTCIFASGVPVSGCEITW
jgi:type IV pilus assembly protein PilM